MTKNAKRISWVAQVIAAAILGQTLFFKFTGAPESIYIFTKLGAEPWGRIGSGLLEAISVFLLLSGRWTVQGAVLAVGLMMGAIGAHLTTLGIVVQGDGGTLFVLAWTVLISATVVLAIRRAQIPVIGGVLSRRGVAALALGLGMSSLTTGHVVAQDETPNTALRSGEFNRIDRGHWARGGVSIDSTEDGTFVLALTDEFASARGPDLRVVLSRHNNPQDGNDLGQYVELDHLRERSGAQRYIIPDGVNATQMNSVVIYCKRFNVIFSVARLTPT